MNEYLSIYLFIYLSFKENIKISNTKFLIHSYERSGRHHFSICFLFRMLFFQQKFSHAEVTAASPVYNCSFTLFCSSQSYPIYGSLRQHPSMVFQIWLEKMRSSLGEKSLAPSCLPGVRTGSSTKSSESEKFNKICSPYSQLVMLNTQEIYEQLWQSENI